MSDCVTGCTPYVNYEQSKLDLKVFFTLLGDSHPFRKIQMSSVVSC